jgi:type II secretory pathway component PulF
MQSVSLDDFLALNDQLAALARAGIALHVDLGRTSAGVEANLERINAVVARRVSQGESLPAALARDDDFLTPSYRTLVQNALRGGGLATALDTARQLAEFRENSRQAVRLSLVYPAIVFGLAYLGMVLFCLFFVPTLESMYQSMTIPAGMGLRALQALQRTLPYWIAIPPLGLVIAASWQRFKSGQVSQRDEFNHSRIWFPGIKRGAFYEECASFAETLAALLDAGTPLDEGMRIASGVWSRAVVPGGPQGLTPSLGEEAVGDSPGAVRLPPFLTWALWHSEATTGRARALRMAADIYRVNAARRQERLQMIAPLATCALLGGGIALLYGLALFVPVVEMLSGLASSH